MDKGTPETKRLWSVWAVGISLANWPRMMEPASSRYGYWQQLFQLHTMTARHVGSCVQRVRMTHFQCILPPFKKKKKHIKWFSFATDLGTLLYSILKPFYPLAQLYIPSSPSSVWIVACKCHQKALVAKTKITALQTGRWPCIKGVYPSSL